MIVFEKEKLILTFYFNFLLTILRKAFHLACVLQLFFSSPFSLSFSLSLLLLKNSPVKKQESLRLSRIIVSQLKDAI